MSEADLHLKLDRILAGQEQILRGLKDADETIRVLIASMSTFRECVDTQTEVINRLSEAMSEEPAGGGDMQELIKSIAVSLKQIKEDGSRIPVLLGQLAPAIAQATQDAVFMAMGSGADIPPKEEKP